MSDHEHILDIENIIRILPQRSPSLLIDRVIEVEPGVRVLVVKNVTIAEPCLAGHFPGLPVMPESVLIEAMVQACSLLIYATKPFDPATKVILMIGANKMKFRRAIRPGDIVEIESELLRRRSNVWRFKNTVFEDDVRVAEGELALSIQNREDVI